MSYTRSASVQKFIDAAHTKLLVYYHDGGKRTWYGRAHIRDGRPAANPRAVEIKRHERYVHSVAKDVKMAILYDLKTGQEMRRFKNGSWSA